VAFGFSGYSAIMVLMKVLVVYKPDSEQARAVTDWLRDFHRHTGKTLEEIDPDTRSGASLCRTYDIVEYPTFLAIDTTGAMQMMWRGTMLPTISEISYYIQD